MSTDMTIDGRIDIAPPLLLTGTLASSRHNPANHPGRRPVSVDLVFDVERNPVTGQQFVTGLVPAVSYWRPVGNPRAEIERLIAEHGSGRVFSGTLHLEDEEGDTSEITAHGDRVEWSDWPEPRRARRIATPTPPTPQL